MTDKVQKIREEVEKLKDEINSPDASSYTEAYIIGATHTINSVLDIIDSLQEEPVSDELFEASAEYAATGEILANGKEMIDFQKQKAFKAGAEWQKEKEYTCYEEAFEDGAKWQKERDQKSMEIMNEVYLKSCDKIRKQMIDKTCEFLKSYRRETRDGMGYVAGIIDDDTIEDFKKLMKD